MNRVGMKDHSSVMTKMSFEAVMAALTQSIQRGSHDSLTSMSSRITVGKCVCHRRNVMQAGLIGNICGNCESVLRNILVLIVCLYSGLSFFVVENMLRSNMRALHHFLTHLPHCLQDVSSMQVLTVSTYCNL